MHSPYPDIDLLRRQAKRLLRQAKEGDPGALRLLPRGDRSPQLADAQYAVAKVVGFSSWPALVRGVESSRGETERPDRRTRLLLVRNGRGDSRGRFNQHDGPPLDEVGRAQATRAAARLAQTVNAEVVDTVVSSRSPRSMETAQVISSILDIPIGEPTCDLCQMHPGAAEGLTQEEMAERFGPNYAFVPGAEAWLDFVPRATASLEGLAQAHRGRTVIAVIEGAMVKAAFIALGKMPLRAAEVIMTDYASITEWSCLVEGDVRRLGTWRLERYNEKIDLGALPVSQVRNLHRAMDHWSAARCAPYGDDATLKCCVPEPQLRERSAVYSCPADSLTAGGWLSRDIERPLCPINNGGLAPHPCR